MAPIEALSGGIPVPRGERRLPAAPGRMFVVGPREIVGEAAMAVQGAYSHVHPSAELNIGLVDEDNLSPLEQALSRSLRSAPDVPLMIVSASQSRSGFNDLTRTIDGYGYGPSLIVIDTDAKTASSMARGAGLPDAQAFSYASLSPQSGMGVRLFTSEIVNQMTPAPLAVMDEKAAAAFGARASHYGTDVLPLVVVNTSRPTFADAQQVFWAGRELRKFVPVAGVADRRYATKLIDGMAAAEHPFAVLCTDTRPADTFDVMKRFMGEHDARERLYVVHNDPSVIAAGQRLLGDVPGHVVDSSAPGYSVPSLVAGILAVRHG